MWVWVTHQKICLGVPNIKGIGETFFFAENSFFPLGNPQVITLQKGPDHGIQNWGKHRGAEEGRLWPGHQRPHHFMLNYAGRLCTCSYFQLFGYMSQYK